MTLYELAMRNGAHLYTTEDPHTAQHLSGVEEEWEARFVVLPIAASGIFQGSSRGDAREAFENERDIRPTRINLEAIDYVTVYVN